jgi:hypothetical protein
MRLRPALLLAAVAVASALPSGDAAPRGTQTTVTKGAPPLLAGRWLAIAAVGAAGRTSNTAAFWDVQDAGDRLVVTERFLELRPEEREAMARADAAGEAWTPPPETIAALSEAWDRLPERDVGLRALEHEIAVPEEFDATLRAEPAAKDALWVVRQRYAFEPGSTVVRREIVWAGVVATRTGYRANVTTSAVGGAPSAVPVTSTGTGTLHRLDDPPASGLFARIAAWFRGCGRATSPPGSGRSAV